MKRMAPSFLLLMGLFKVALCVLFGKHVLVERKMNWFEARDYCRQHFTDISSVHTTEDFNAITSATNDMHVVWIGLYKSANDIWKWSGGESASVVNTSVDDSKVKGNSCVSHDKHGWHAQDCNKDAFDFSCFESSLKLVKEKKTWEEGMQNCRQQDSELISVTSEPTLIRALQTSRGVRMEHLWISLRHLAGSWLWVDRNRNSYEAGVDVAMPNCPDAGSHCGALSLRSGYLVNLDCTKKFYFLCY